MPEPNTTIVRQPDESDKKFIGDDGYAVTEFIGYKRKLTSKQKFENDLGEHMTVAIKKKLPFADRVAREDFENHFKGERDKALREKGSVEAGDFTLFKPDWAKYSDLKNFEILEEKERTDEYLTKINPGLFVNVKAIKYQFRGYSNTYTVMEDGPSAIKRAQEVVKKSR